jgi:hypothetical protein
MRWSFAMKVVIAAAALLGLVMAPVLAAESSGTAKRNAPGQKQHHPGEAKKYAPGQKQRYPGEAKKYAPGQKQNSPTTTGRGGTRD